MGRGVEGLGFEGFHCVTASRFSREAAIAHEVLSMLKTADIKRLAFDLTTMTEWLAKSAAASCGKLHGGWRRRDKARGEEVGEVHIVGPFVVAVV